MTLSEMKPLSPSMSSDWLRVPTTTPQSLASRYSMDARSFGPYAKIGVPEDRYSGIFVETENRV